MNAVVQTEVLELKLGPKPGLPRELHVRRETRGALSVAVWTPKRKPGQPQRMLAFTLGDSRETRAEVTRYRGDGRLSLWIGSASFQVTTEERDEIVTTFGITETEFGL